MCLQNYYDLGSGSIVMLLLKDPRPPPRGIHLFALPIQFGFSWFVRKKCSFLTFDSNFSSLLSMYVFSCDVCWVPWSFCFSYSLVCGFGLYLFILHLCFLWHNEQIELRFMFRRHCSNYVIFNMVSNWEFLEQNMYGIGHI